MILFLAAFLYSIYLLVVFSIVATLTIVNAIIQVVAFVVSTVDHYIDEKVTL